MIQALVTGSDGFIGRSLVKRLDELGVKLICVDKVPKTHHSWSLDVASEKFLTYFRYRKFDYIFHFGSPCSILQFHEDPKYCVGNTLKGFWNALRLAEICHAKLIYPSSGNVYGSKDSPHSETDIPIPCNIYGLCKLWCETMAQHSSADTLGLRIFCGYGSGEEMKGCLASVLYLFLNDMMKGISPIIWGNGSQIRDFIHIDDIVDGIIASMSPRGVKVLNLASGYSTNYNDLVKLINEILGTDIIPQYVEKPGNYVLRSRNYVDKTFADVTLMRSTLRLNPRSLEVGIKQFSEYLL